MPGPRRFLSPWCCRALATARPARVHGVCSTGSGRRPSRSAILVRPGSCRYRNGRASGGLRVVGEPEGYGGPLSRAGQGPALAGRQAPRPERAGRPSSRKPSLSQVVVTALSYGMQRSVERRVSPVAGWQRFPPFWCIDFADRVAQTSCHDCRRASTSSIVSASPAVLSSRCRTTRAKRNARPAG